MSLVVALVYSHDVHDPILFCFFFFFFFFPLPFAKTHGRISQIWWSKCKCLMSLKVRMVASLSPVHLIPASGTILKPQQARPRGPVFTEPASLNGTFAPQLPKLYLLHVLLLFSLSVSLFQCLISLPVCLGLFFWFDVSVNSFVSVILLAIFCS